ncbi:DisA bacterial checkpoint controller nucleotide-binding protein [Novipirellula galeiformis]|uniref:DisA bacterial checkpoint controller nucleotide-binding protein n=1 Tax=Novipirellula galeiformis TaxID=2528004 RepID=A0A5C6CE11_9BACT|nr:diadenylate cyclase [Novipirellula galeiformis]TWU22332.1 DisA bacterial checkpoint controller nucleotide-binding protein [Novipirellula galeiformis]
MAGELRELVDQFRIADALDIGIVTMVMYVLLVWLCNRATQSVGLVFLLIVAIYLLAGWLEMYLTTMIFQYGIIGAIFASIVIFQQDIRHGIERVSSSRWLRQSSTEVVSQPSLDTIVNSVAMLASQEVGALIVFPGREPLGPHVRGGVRVDAEISEPLLLSIFHPESPGHDGAVLIEQQRIGQLSLHLPLSSNLMKVQGGGTRHAAALGLSECCDALVVVVSEERGTITMAHNGVLEEVDPETLGNRLKTFLANQTVSREAHPGTALDRLTIKSASLTLAVLLWFLFAYQTATVQRTVMVPIEYRNLSENWVVDEPKMTHAEVTLVGSDKAFQHLDLSAMTVSLELKEVREGVPMRLPTEKSLQHVPSELTVNRVEPHSVYVVVRKKQATTPLEIESGREVER